MSDVTLTIGHIARHTPHGAGAQGRDAAIVDIAQDLLLRHLQAVGVLDDDERILAQAREQDRPLALRALAVLPGGRLTNAGLH